MLLSAAVRDTARHLLLQEPQRLLLQGADDLTVASPPEATPPDPSDNGSEYLGPEDLSYWAVLFSLLLMVVNVAVSGWLRLGMELPLAVASARCIVQLVLVGYILRLIFPHYVLALLYTGIMLSVASLEAMSRPPHAYKGMLRHLIVAIGSPSYVVGAYTMVLCIGNGSWQQARYIIPLIGMLMGNCVTSVVLGQKTLMDEVKSGKDSIEWALAMGASRREALMPILQRCMSTAITPLLNQLALVGIVSLPGTMNGAILGGVDPEQAARYQVVIMFMLGSATTAAALLGVLGAAYHIVDDSHRLRLDRLTERHHSNFSRWGLAQVAVGVDAVDSAPFRIFFLLHLNSGLEGGTSWYLFLFGGRGKRVKEWARIFMHLQLHNASGLAVAGASKTATSLQACTGKKVVQKVASMWHRLRSSAQVGRAPWRMDSFLGLHWWQAVPENDEMMQQRGVLRDGIMSDTESLAGSIFSDGAPGTDPAGGSARHGRGVLDRESLPALGRTSASVRDSTIPEH